MSTCKKRVFKVSKKEEAKIEQWVKEHSCVVDRSGDEPVIVDTIGAEVSYIFTPTGLGTIFKVRCKCCGAELDLTDYKSW